MSKIDWNSDSLSIRAILEGLMDGIEEERYAYTSDIDSNMLESVLYEAITEQSLKEINIVNLIKLDNYGITGNNLLKLWYMCKENSDYFKKTVSYITGTMLDRCFKNEEIIKNMDLKQPISFIPDDESIIPFYELSRMRQEIGNEKVDEIIFILRSNLVRDYNRYVRFYNLANELLEEPERPVLENTDLPDDEELDISRLYFGLNTVDMSGGVLGINMQSYSMFERSNQTIKIGEKTLYPLKEIPSGEVVLIDDEGKKFEMDEEIVVDGISILPTKKFIYLSVCPIKTIIEDAKERGMSYPLIDIYDSKIFYDRRDISVSESMSMFSDLTDMYQRLYGGLGNNMGSK